MKNKITNLSDLIRDKLYYIQDKKGTCGIYKFVRLKNIQNNELGLSFTLKNDMRNTTIIYLLIPYKVLEDNDYIIRPLTKMEKILYEKKQD